MQVKKDCGLDKLFATLLIALVMTACGKDDDSDSSATKTSLKVVIDGGAALAAPGETEGDDDSSAVPACKSFLDVDSEMVSVSGSGKTVDLTPSDALMIKVTGNQDKVNISIKPVGSDNGAEDGQTLGLAEETPDEEAPTIAGICFRLGGNKAQASLKVEGVKVTKLGFIGRGNEPTVAYVIGDKAEVTTFLVDTKGHAPSLTVSGTGKFDCPTGDSVDCTEPPAE